MIFFTDSLNVYPSKLTESAPASVTVYSPTGISLSSYVKFSSKSARVTTLVPYFSGPVIVNLIFFLSSSDSFEISRFSSPHTKLFVILRLVFSSSYLLVNATLVVSSFATTAVFPVCTSPSFVITFTDSLNVYPSMSTASAPVSVTV